MDSPHVQPTLPLDVLSEIIEVLDVDDDAPTLRSLSMSCATLLEPSQRRLFSKISIKMDWLAPASPKPKYLALKNLFIKSPHLATYVSHLRLSFKIPHPDTSIVASIVEKLVALKRLRLHDRVDEDNNPERNLEWRAFISQALQRPSLLELELDGYGELPSSALHLQALRSIKLGCWRIEEADMLTTPHITTLPRRLVITWIDHSSIEILRRFLGASPHLRELELHYPSTPIRFSI